MPGAPNSYKDPYWTGLAANVETKLGLPTGLLEGIITRGERSNADQVSEAGARTPFQIIPSTRKAAIDKWGIDPMLSPENAAEVAGRLLKESLDRNKGDPSLAVAEYHGGTNRANWGPRTRAYVQRVVGAQSAPAANEPAPTSKYAALENDFAKFMAANPAVPAGRSTSAVPAPTEAAPKASNTLDDDFGRFLASNPQSQEAAPAAPEMGFIDRIKEAVTGEQRRTGQTQALPDWAAMPELNSFSLASAKTGLGTLLSNPQETVQIIKANFPGVQVGQDEKGNYLLTSSIDGKQYAIKPGFQLSDIPRAGAAVAAFTPAGRAATLPGMALGAGATQAAIEASQAAVGGEFNPAEVATAAVLAPVVPAAVNAVRAVAAPVRAGVARALGRAEPAIAPTAAASRPQGAPAPDAPPITPRDPSIRVTPEGVAITPEQRAAQEAAAQTGGAPAAATQPGGTPAMTGEQLAQTAKKAASGNIGSKTATTALAEQAAPDAATIAAAKRLGIEEHLQPDHVTTSQAYRELAQAAKSVPGSSTHAAEIQGLEKVAQRAEGLIDEIGGTTDLSALDAGVKARMRSTVAELEKQADDLYARVRNEIPLKAEAPANNTLKFIRQRAEELGGEANLSPMEKRILARLTPKAATKLETVPGDPEAVGLMTGQQAARQVPAQTVRQPTYALLDDVRKDLGAAARRAGPFKDADTGLAKKLYSLLTDDQAAVVGSHGATELFNAAKASVAVRKGLEDDLTALFGKTTEDSLIGSLSGAVRALPQGDTSKLLKLLSAVPPEMRQQVVASGLASAFRTAGTRGPINFGTYAKWYEGLLRNKNARSAVMTNLPGPARKQLSDLYRVSRGISASTRERITTGRIQAVQEQFKDADTLAGRLYESAMRHAVSAGAGTVAGAVGGPGIGAAVASALSRGAKPNALKAVDALISSPEFIQATRSGGNQAARIRAFAYSRAFTNFMRAVGQPREMSNREKWVMQALQGRNNT